MKNGSHTTIMYEKDRGRRWSSANGGKTKIDCQEKWCTCVRVCGETGKDSFTMSCYRSVKRLILTSTVNNWKNYIKQSRESDQNWLLGKTSSSITTTLYVTHIWRLIKNWENLVGKLGCIYFIVLILQHQNHLFRSLQNSLNDVKLTSKKAYENHLSQFFAQKSQKFYSYEIIVLSQKWQKMNKKRHIFILINFIQNMNKTCFTFALKYEETVSPTQYLFLLLIFI